MKKYRQQMRYSLDHQAQAVVAREAVRREVSESRALEEMLHEWAEIINRVSPEPTVVALHDSSTGKRIDELQRTVETLTQKVQALTLRDRLGKYSKS